MLQRDTTSGTITIAAILCVVCSIVVSATAVGLRPIKQKNQQLAFQQQVLSVLGLFKSGENTQADIPQLFEQVKPMLIDIETGTEAEVEGLTLESFDLKEVSENPNYVVPIPADQDLAGIGEREKYTKIYLLTKDSGELDQIVLPIRGKGLWSTMWGLLALDADGKTVRGLTFYDDGETPGLGGEINNVNWKQKWSNPECPKQLYGESGNVSISFYKGALTCETPNSEHLFEALGGATITTRGVQNTMHYWLGDHGYKTLIHNLTSGELAVTAAR